MPNDDLEQLKRVAEAAINYVTIANNPPSRPSHKALDAERQAFDRLEEAVNDAVKAEPRLGKFTTPEDEGAWS
jgi:hypothetical protein